LENKVCPNCGNNDLVETSEEFVEDYGPHKALLRYSAPLVNCTGCWFSFTDFRKEDAQIEAIRNSNHLFLGGGSMAGTSLRAFPYQGEKLVVKSSSTYDNGRMAIELLTVDGEPYTTLSVNLPDEPDPNEGVVGPGGLFYAKTWSENSLVREAALASGWFEDTGKRVPAGYAEAEVWRLK
jgi:hypothetical protein